MRQTDECPACIAGFAAYVGRNARGSETRGRPNASRNPEVWNRSGIARMSDRRTGHRGYWEAVPVVIVARRRTRIRLGVSASIRARAALCSASERIGVTRIMFRSPPRLPCRTRHVSRTIGRHDACWKIDLGDQAVPVSADVEVVPIAYFVGCGVTSSDVPKRGPDRRLGDDLSAPRR